ncbi:MAG TPA: hypothetical protein VM328_01775 [Fimbriimonadaceae bacterium]|nr:hypothetical protein [Fimbriimonadaceae bacterium]
MMLRLVLALAMGCCVGCGGSKALSIEDTTLPPMNYGGNYIGEYRTQSGVVLGTIVGFVSEHGAAALDTTSAADAEVMRWRGTVSSSGAYNGSVTVAGVQHPATGIWTRGSGSAVRAEMQYTLVASGITKYHRFEMTKL